MMFSSHVRRVVTAAIAALCASTALAAQQQGATLTGRVLDAAAAGPIPSAQIQIIGLNRGAVTGDDGRFRITNVKPGQYQVRALRIGFKASTKSVTLTAGATATTDFSLTRAIVSLDEVVTTATGATTRKREQGSDVGTLTPAPEALASASTPSQLLTGKVAGVDVSTSGGTIGSGSRIRIRGASSLSLSNEPIVIIDGIRFSNAFSDNNTSGSTTLGVGGQVPSRFNDINADDIDHIEVLKGPAAAALYGTAAANGVVVITTKKGANAKPKWNAYGEGGTIRNTTTWPANYARVGTLTNGKRTTNCTLDSQGRGLCTPVPDSLVSFNPLEVYSPFMNGYHEAAGLGVQGGTDAVNYYLAGNYQRDQGVLAISQDQRAGGRGNISAQLRDNWNIQIGTSYLADHVRLPQNDNDVFGVMGGGLLGKAFDDPKTHAFFEGVPPETFYAINTRQDVQRFENSINTSYQPLGWLTATGVFGLDYLNRYDNETLGPNLVNFGQSVLGYRTSNPYQIFNYTSTGSLSAVWNPTTDFKSTTTGAIQFNKELVRGTRAFGRALLAGTGSLSGTTSQFSVGETNTDNKTLGLIGREELSWRDRVFLTGALRNDKNSAFGQNFGSITYPSVQASWVISDESFFPKSSILSSLRLRAADGRSGRQPNFRDAETYFSAQTVTVNGADVPGIVVGGTGNPNLRPEKSTEDEFGADLGLWGQRLGLQVTHYEKTTTDVLVAVPLAPSLGQTTTQFQNLGRLSNKGWEYTLNADLLNTDQIGFSFTATGSKNDNKILSLGFLPSGDEIPPIVINSDQQHRVNHPVGGYWAVPYTYADANGDHMLSRNEITFGDSAVYFGNPSPTHQFSVSPTVTFFKNFRVTALFDHKGGQKLLNLTRRFRCALGNCQENFDPNSSLADQAAAIATTVSSTDAGYIEDATFTKLRELSFTVTFPQRVATAFRARNIDLTLAGRNLHTWTNYRGFDPEVNSTPDANFGTSDFLTLPPNRTWTARFNVNF